MRTSNKPKSINMLSFSPSNQSSNLEMYVLLHSSTQQSTQQPTQKPTRATQTKDSSPTKSNQKIFNQTQTTQKNDLSPTKSNQSSNSIRPFASRPTQQSTQKPTKKIYHLMILIKLRPIHSHLSSLKKMICPLLNQTKTPILYALLFLVRYKNLLKQMAYRLTLSKLRHPCGHLARINTHKASASTQQAKNSPVFYQQNTRQYLTNKLMHNHLARSQPKK